MNRRICAGREARALWIALLLATLAGPGAWSQTVRPSRTVLPNGLTVLAVEDHTLPSVAVSITYRVGSRNERPGITGLSHLFEHMMFNGSARYPAGSFDRIIEGGGGYSNAGTGPDNTEYYEECSSQTLDKALALEADRMRALDISRRNLEQERGIVKEERRQGTDDSVEGSMRELLWNTAFVAHPYRWDVIGFMKDIDSIRVEDARAYFRTHYVPNNAVLAVVGDVRVPALFATVRRLFGTIPRGPAQERVVNAEPPQRGEKRAALHREARLPAVHIGYRIGSYKHADDPALDLLSIILSGGESSRLHRSLVRDKRVATAVSSYNESRLDAGLFTIYAQAQSGHTAAECEQAVYAVLDDVARNGVAERELQKARNATRVGWVGRFTTNIGRAGVLTEFEGGWGDWRRYRAYLPARERVTAADIRRVAAKYFTDRHRAVVTLVPDSPAQTAGAVP